MGTGTPVTDTVFLLFLIWWGFSDLRHRRIKHWQVTLFGFYVLLTAFWQGSFSLYVLGNALGVLALGWVGYVNGRWGAADVKIITISSLYHLYHFDPWWVWQALLLTAILDLCLWGFYFFHREQTSPLLFSWLIAVLTLYVWYQIRIPA